MIKTILLFVFLFFSVLGILISFVAVLLKASAPGGKSEIFLVSLPGEDEKEELLRVRWLEAVLSITGLKDRIRVADSEDNRLCAEILSRSHEGTDENT